MYPANGYFGPIRVAVNSTVQSPLLVGFVLQQIHLNHPCQLLLSCFEQFPASLLAIHICVCSLSCMSGAALLDWSMNTTYRLSVGGTVCVVATERVSISVSAMGLSHMGLKLACPIYAMLIPHFDFDPPRAFSRWHCLCCCNSACQYICICNGTVTHGFEACLSIYAMLIPHFDFDPPQAFSRWHCLCGCNSACQYICICNGTVTHGFEACLSHICYAHPSF
jgi:hypothetical protein